jgi:hypothetical protein
MASIVYQNAYALTGGGANWTVNGSDLGGPFTLSEEAASSNASLVPQEYVDITGTGWTGVNPRYTSYVTIGGVQYPIINTNSGTRYILTNETLSNDQSLTASSGSTPICFGPDTLIKTPTGFVAVSELSIGDQVSTHLGPKIVKFVGLSARFTPELRACGRMPILISAGALGELGPAQDLLCSPAHAFSIEGLLVEAQALVDGTSIRQLNSLDSLSFTYYSIELDDHALIWANGLLAETYFANFRSSGISRDAWDNYQEYVELYGESQTMKELDLPRVPFARQLPSDLLERVGVKPSEIAVMS